VVPLVRLIDAFSHASLARITTRVDERALDDLVLAVQCADVLIFDGMEWSVCCRYKTPDDKPLNAFGYNEKALDKAHALKVHDTSYHIT
jgi:predicted nucleotidyltransferase